LSNRIQAIYELGQSIWCDSISRRMIDSGELQRLINLGVVGVTSNPTIFMKAVTTGSAYDELFNKLLDEGLDTPGVYEGLVIRDIADAADRLKPVYERTDGVDGFVSLEVNPNLAYDTAGTIAEARRLFGALNRDNVFIKVPATEEGIPAIAALIGEGVNVNVTLIFGIRRYEEVAKAYISGLNKLQADGGDVTRVASVASFFVSRVDTLVDKLLEVRGTAGDSVDHLRGGAAIANAKLAYTCFEAMFSEGGAFAPLEEAGARVQRPLWASTSTKNPAYPDTKYVDGLIGPNTVNTLPPETIEAALDHAATGITIDDEVQESRELCAELAALGISIDEVTDKLLVDGVELFTKSYDDLLADLERKAQSVRVAGR